jgi:hypothetical protein|tara:strand:- start:1921 stop:2241 length:321 start_codon:yes stop_codon:yes gene_type:complete
MEDIIEETKTKTTLIEIVYNDSSDLKKLASKEEFRTFIIKDSLESIKNALKYGDDKVELFNIFNLSLTVELKRSNFKSVLNNITKYYINDEDYEMCNQIKKLIDEI